MKTEKREPHPTFLVSVTLSANRLSVKLVGLGTKQDELCRETEFPTANKLVQAGESITAFFHVDLSPKNQSPYKLRPGDPTNRDKQALLKQKFVNDFVTAAVLEYTLRNGYAVGEDGRWSFVDPSASAPLSD